MAEMKRVMLIIDDRPAVVGADTQEKIIERAISPYITSVEKALLEFDEITNREALLKLALAKRATHVICARIPVVRAFIRDFMGLCELISDLNLAGIQFQSVQEGISTEDDVGHLLNRLVVGWREASDAYKHENPKVSQLKAKLRGHKLGRRKKRDDRRINKLRKEGLSIRDIAVQTGVSTAAVQRALKESKDRTLD